MTLTEEQRGTVAFDPEKARASIAHYRIENPSNVDTESALKELVDQANLAEDALAEIERLRAETEEAQESLTAAYLLGSHKKAQEMAARIKSLKKEIRRLKHESKVEQEFTNSYIKHLHEAEARIKELEDALVEELARGDYFDESQECEGYWWDRKNTTDCTQNDYRRNARLKLQAKGKIGPDAKPRSWQITEERIGLLEYCLETLLDAPDIEEIPGPGHSIEMLRAMLREAEQCE